MGEKLKDLVYDFSDIIISLIIITMIFGVVSWKISDSMAYSTFTDEGTKASVEKTNETPADNADATSTVNVDTKDETASTTGSDQAVTSTGGKPAAGNTTNQTATTGNTAGSSNTTTNTATTNTTTTTPPTNTAPTGDFKVEIPSGSSGIAIAKILKDKSIISDTKMFITRVDQLKLGSKLKAGSFTIKAGSTLDEVIYTLTGKK